VSPESTVTAARGFTQVLIFASLHSIFLASPRISTRGKPVSSSMAPLRFFHAFAHTRLLFLAILAMALVPSTAAHADGKVFSLQIADTNISDQHAVIAFANGQQTLLIETRFTGDGRDFAWVVPVPAEPTVELGSRGALQTARAILQPRLERHPVQGPLIVVLGAFLLLIPTLLHIDRGSRKAQKPWHERLARAIAGTIAVTILVFMIGVFAPSLGGARSRAPAADPIEILQQSNIGAYDVRVVRSADPRAMLDWLNAEKFGVSEASTTAINGYVRDGWCFVAAKLRADASADARRSPEPLLMRFATAQPVYPMRLTATGSTNLALDLYVFGPKRASVSGMTHVCSKPIVDADPSSYESAVAYISHPALLNTIGPATIATRLRGTFTPAQMQSDLNVTWTDDEPHVPTVYSASHAREMGYAIAGLTAWALLLAAPHVFRRLRKTNTRSAALALCTAFVAFPVASIMLGVPRLYDTVETTPGRRPLAHLHRTIMYFVAEVAANIPARSVAESQDDYLNRLGAAITATLDADPTHPLKQLNLREGDIAPGFKFVPDIDGNVWIETYEATSTRQDGTVLMLTR